MAAIKPTEEQLPRVASMEKSDDNGAPQLKPATGERKIFASTFQDGDGQLLAEYEGKGFCFHAKLKGIKRAKFGNLEGHILEIQLNFMKPFLHRNRYRGAKVDVYVRKATGDDEPRILRLSPVANSLQVSDLEVTTGQTVTASGGGNGGPANVNLGIERSSGKKTSYHGVRLIHGVIKGSGTASWRFYEESASETGLPPVVNLLLLVHCGESDFSLNLEMSVQYRNFWRMLSNIQVPEDKRPHCVIPNLDGIEKNDSDEMCRRVKQLLRKAKTLTDSENKRLEDFAKTLQGEFTQPSLPEEGNSTVHDAEQTIRSMIAEAKGHRITDAEAKVLILYYASIKRANRDKLGKLASAGEFWDTARGILEWESVGEEK
jgi:hypothetical protein